MEAERLVPELPGTTPFGVATSEARSASLTCASASRGAASIEGLLSPAGTSESGSAALPLYSADARTEQAFFGNFLPVSSGLRYAFMRRCPSAPSELSAADQQRLLQQQRLHVHLLQLERKVSMQERLLYLVQKYGDAPTLLQQQGAAGQLPASACKAENALPWEELQCLSKKGDDNADKSGFPVPPSIALFNGKRCLSLAEMSLTSPSQQRDLSIPGGSGVLKGMNFGAVENMRETEAEGHKHSALVVKTDAVDDGTPSTAAVSEHSPASDKRAEALCDGGSGETDRVANSSVAGVGASGDSCVQSSAKNASALPAGIRGERAAVGAAVLPPEQPPTKKAHEEKDERTAGALLWHSLASADSQAPRPEELIGYVSLARTSELPSAQQPAERGAEIAREEVYEQSVEKGGVDPAETLSIRRATDVDGEKKTRELVGSSSLAGQMKEVEKEEREGLAGAAGGRKPEGMRRPDQFFRIKLCAKYIRRTCRKGSRCSYAHAEEELREIPNLWKTKLCATHKLGKPCPLDTGCPFAHGEEELRCTAEYYKTKLCKFWVREARCEAGEGCRHAHGAAELRQRTYHYGELARSGLRVLRQESQQALEANSGTHTGPKDVHVLEAPAVRPVPSPATVATTGKRSGAGLPMAAKAQEQKTPEVRSGSKNDRPRTRSGQGEDRQSQVKQSPPRQNDEEVSGNHRRSDAAQEQGASAQQRSASKLQKRGKGEDERRSSGKGRTGEVGSMRGPVKRRGGKGGGGFRACENTQAGSTRRERRASASATVSGTLPSGNGGCRKNSGGKESRRRSGHGPSQHHGGGGKGAEGRDSLAPPVLGKRRNTVGSHGVQRTPPSYYGSLNKNGPAHYFAGTPPAQDQAGRTALHAQIPPHFQHQSQTQMHSHQKFRMAESSALNMANADASALYGLTPGINPYGALAPCQQQAPYGLSLLPAGPPSCGNLQTAAAAAAAVAAMAQQQQQFEAAAKAVGTPVYQGMPFLAPAPFAAFTPSHLSYAAPAHALAPPFAASHVGGGGPAGVRSCGAAYAASYPVYPYSSSGPSSLVADANGGAAAPCVSPSYSPRGISVPCSVCSYDAGGREVCVLSSEQEGLQADGVQADVRTAEPAPGRYISRSSSLNTAAAGHPPHAAETFAERATHQYPGEWMQEGGSRCSYGEHCGPYARDMGFCVRPT